MDRKKHKKTIIALLFIEGLAFFILAGIVSIGLMGIILRPDEKMLTEHLANLKKSIEVYQSAEKETEKSVIAFLQTRVDTLAWMIRSGIVEPTQENLLEYKDKLEAENVMIMDEDYNVLDFAIEEELGDKEINGVVAKIDEDRVACLELDLSEMIDTFDRAVSWEHAVIQTVIGRHGYAFVADAKTEQVTLHPNEEMVGEKIDWLDTSPKEFV